MPPTTVSISPEPDVWRSAMAEHRSQHARDRETLGLPTDRPVVMSGHQPVLWHAGILAKLLAASELAERTHAAVCWIVADMDDVDPTTVRVPDGTGPGTKPRIVRTLAGDPPPPGVPAGALPPREAGDDDPSIAGLAPLLDAYAHEPTLAMQAGRAVIYQACERFGIDEPIVISCSDLARTDAWRALVASLARDPGPSVRAYNGAVGAHPDARMRPLRLSAERVELPLWRVRERSPRLAVFGDEIDAIPPEELRPRALAMTAVARAALCELFVHGTGGGLYDRITGNWFDAWDGSPGWALAPTAVATADAYADLGVDARSLPDPADAVWRAHHARHDPGMLGDERAAERKRDLIGRIDATKRAGGDPSGLFAELQSLLEQARVRHAPRIEELGRAARDARSLAGLRELALDRTWPWPVLTGDTLDGLHQGIRDRFASVPSKACTDASS